MSGISAISKHHKPNQFQNTQGVGVQPPGGQCSQASGSQGTSQVQGMQGIQMGQHHKKHTGQLDLMG